MSADDMLKRGGIPFEERRQNLHEAIEKLNRTFLPTVTQPEEVTPTPPRTRPARLRRRPSWLYYCPCCGAPTDELCPTSEGDYPSVCKNCAMIDSDV